MRYEVQPRGRSQRPSKVQPKQRCLGSLTLGTIVAFLVVLLRTNPSILWSLIEDVGLLLILLIVVLGLLRRRATLKSLKRREMRGVKAARKRP